MVLWRRRKPGEGDESRGEVGACQLEGVRAGHCGRRRRVREEGEHGDGEEGDGDSGGGGDRGRVHGDWGGGCVGRV